MKAGRLIGTLLVVLTGLAGCGSSLSTEQQIIAAIRNMEAHVEAAETRRFLTFIADDFSAQQGQLNRDRLRALVVLQLKRYGQIHARLFPISVVVMDESQARARFRVLLTGGTGWLPEKGQMVQFDTQWRLREGRWELLQADWERVPLEDVL